MSWARDEYGVTVRGFVAGLIAGIAVALLAAGGIGALVDRRNCAYASREYQRPTRWDFLAGCYIDAGDGRYVQLGRFVAVRGAR